MDYILKKRSWLFHFILFFLTGGIWAVVYFYCKNKKQKYNYKNNLMSETEKMKYEEKIKNKEIKKQNSINRNKIIKTAIISNTTDSRKKAGSTIIRGAVGGSILGPVGMLGGAMSGKNKVTNKTTFLIEYADGHRETKEVKNNSIDFKYLCDYLDM